MTLSKYAHLSHDEIVSRLRGQTLHVPNLTTLFSHWPSASKNTNYTTLQTTVHESLTTIAATHPASQRRLDDDIALLSSLGYPQANLLQARILALYVVWLVCWDDEVDANEGDMAGDFSKAEAWREETVQVVIAALCAGGAHGTIGGKDPLHDILLDLGKSLEGHYTVQQRQRVADKIILFVRNCATEQKLRLEGKIPSYEEYMTMRIETVAGGTLCSLIEYSRGVTLPTTLFGSSSRDELDRQVSTLLSLLNDILSLKKELKTDCVINAVATLMTQEKTLDDVVAEVVTKMQGAVEALDVAASQLQTLASTDEERAIATMYIDGCKSLVTGTLEFTLKSPRYNIARLLAEDGSLKIVL